MKRPEAPLTEPRAYLSTSGGHWRLISGGATCTRDTDEATARRAAVQFRCDLSHGWIWDGDAGAWRREVVQ